MIGTHLQNLEDLVGAAIEIPGHYTPSAWGTEYHGSLVDELMGGGSAGPGKSLVMLHDANALIVCEQTRCQRGWMKWGASEAKVLHLRRELGMLEETLGRAHRAFKVIDPGHKFKEELGKPTFTLSSGLKYIFGGCKDEQDFSQYQSAQYVRVYYDELTQFTKKQYDNINTRCRSSDPLLRKFIAVRGATNPEANWVRDYFVAPHPAGRKPLRLRVKDRDGKTYETTRMYLPATLDDNPDPQFREDYKRRLATKPAHIRAALLYADWYAVADAFFAEEWVRAHHVIKPFTIPKGWTIFRTLDWGYKSWGVCHWWAVTPDDELICIREYSFRREPPDKVAKRIKEIEQDLGVWGKGRSRITGPADHNLWEDREGSVSKAEVMAKHGVTWVRANKASKAANAERLAARLMDLDGDFPGFCVFDTCTKLIETLPGIKADENKPDQPAKGPNDHWLDSALYACGHRATPGNDNWDGYDDDDREVTPSRDRGRLGYGW